MLLRQHHRRSRLAYPQNQHQPRRLTPSTPGYHPTYHAGSPLPRSMIHGLLSSAVRQNTGTCQHWIAANNHCRSTSPCKNPCSYNRRLSTSLTPQFYLHSLLGNRRLPRSQNPTVSTFRIFPMDRWKIRHCGVQKCVRQRLRCRFSEFTTEDYDIEALSNK